VERHVAPILVVIADPTYRELVGQCVEAIEREPRLFASWRDAIARTTAAPTLIVADLDDLGTNTRGLSVIRRVGWGEMVPLVVLGYGADIEDRAAAVGALAGFRKPLSIGWFMASVGRLVEKGAG
jgi:DNA-binding NtrC family response regulator